MHTFISFLFDAAQLAHWVVPEWCRFLDRSFVEGSIIRALDSQRPAAERWLEARREAAFGRPASAAAAADAGASGTPGRAVSARKPLMPGPPMPLAEPRKPPPPAPVLLPPVFRASPMPTDVHSRTLEEVEVRLMWGVEWGSVRGCRLPCNAVVH